MLTALLEMTSDIEKDVSAMDPLMMLCVSALVSNESSQTDPLAMLGWL
jgi:hypothetical protein